MPHKPASQRANQAGGRPGTPERIPLWLWPTVLSLDAPAVALCWLGLFSAVYGVPLRRSLYASLGMCVWLIYVGDRLLDSIPPPTSYEPPRHQFYRHHRLAIFVTGSIAAIAFAAFSLMNLRSSVLRAELTLAGIVTLYFLVTHFGGKKIRRHWPKELMVAVLFTSGALLPIWTLATSRASLLLPPWLLLTAILWINALAIECWETAPDALSRKRLQPRISREMALRLGAVAVSVALTACALALSHIVNAEDSAIYGAVALSAFLLAMLERIAPRLSRSGLRVLADTALLTPILFLAARWFYG